jgi:hypothetical protein
VEQGFGTQATGLGNAISLSPFFVGHISAGTGKKTPLEHFLMRFLLAR